MVDKLQEIRDKKDRAEEEYSEAIRDTVKELRRDNPMWTLHDIANAVGLTRQRVSQLLQSDGASVAPIREIPVVVLTCGFCNKKFERPERVHLYRQGRGVKGTYCGSTCQRHGLGLWQRTRSRRTECSKGHAMTQSNTVLTTTRGASGKAYKGRRCRTCRNTYARNYYHDKQQALNTLKGLSDAMQDVIEEVRADGIRV